MTISEKTISVEGCPVHYFEGGEANGRALLLLPSGIGDARTNWGGVMPTLAESFHVFTPDLPGYTGSDALPEMTIANLVHWVRALLDILHQTDAVLVGSFLGGALARLFAAAEPQYVPAVILVNGGTIPRVPGLLQPVAGFPVISEFTFRMFGRVQPLKQLIYAEGVLTNNLTAAWHANASGFAQLMRAVLYTPVPEKQTPLVPTLLLWGMNDPLMTPAHAARLQEEIPGALFAPIAECGHMPQLEATEAFMFQITSFLDRISRPVAPALPGVGLLHSD